MAQFKRSGRPSDKRPNRSSAGGFKKSSTGNSGKFFSRNDKKDRGADEKRPARGDYSDSGFKKQLFSATCANCGESCEVPFRPSHNKPVYCNDCFKPEVRGDYGVRGGGKKPGSSSRDLEQINRKLDMILRILDK